jgi:hypothetical protein
MSKLYEVYRLGAFMTGMTICTTNTVTSYDSPILVESQKRTKNIDKSNHIEFRREFFNYMGKYISLLVGKSAVYAATWPITVPYMAYHSTLNTDDLENHFVLGSKYSGFDDITKLKARLLD